MQICIWAYVEIDQKPVAIEVAKLFFAGPSLAIFFLYLNFNDSDRVLSPVNIIKPRGANLLGLFLQLFHSSRPLDS